MDIGQLVTFYLYGGEKIVEVRTGQYSPRVLSALRGQYDSVVVRVNSKEFEEHSGVPKSEMSLDELLAQNMPEYDWRSVRWKELSGNGDDPIFGHYDYLRERKRKGDDSEW